MFEFLFFVTAVYLGYVAKEAYQAVGRAEKGEPVFIDPPKPAAKPKAAGAPAPKPVAKAAPEPAKAEVKAEVKATQAEPKKAPAAKPQKTAAAKAPAKPKKTADSKPLLAEDLKNPETGEITPAPANYRFAKKWIKEALVSEKLLDRVYKPNELDDAATIKVKEALDALRSLKKYQA